MNRPFVLLAGSLLAIISSVFLTSPNVNAAAVLLAQAKTAEDLPKFDPGKRRRAVGAPKLRRQAREKDAEKRKLGAKALLEKRKQQTEKRKQKAQAEANKRKAETTRRKAEADRRKAEADRRKAGADRRKQQADKVRVQTKKARPDRNNPAAAARALLQDKQPARGLSDGALGRRIKGLREALKVRDLPQRLARQLRRRLAQDTGALRDRSARNASPDARGRNSTRDKDRADRNRDGNRARERVRRDRDRDSANRDRNKERANRDRNRDRGRPDDRQVAAARALLRDRRPVRGMSDGALSRRVKALRDILKTRGLPRDLSRRLRLRLAQDRKALRDRVAARNDTRDADPRRDRPRDRARAPERGRRLTLRGLLADRRPARRLGRRALAVRIRAARDVLTRRNLDRRDKADISRLLRRDRAEFRNRLRARRARRARELARNRDRLRQRFDRQPPARFGRRPDVAAAEVGGDAIERQLLASPVRRLRRRYSLAEIRRNPDLRLVMPALEIDTVQFGFDSASVAPEEVAKLERVGAIIERILIGRPGEVYLIEGHTDAPGSFEYNQELSQKRAEAVRKALLEYFVIPPEALVVAGFGEDYLRVRTQEAEAENRRVTVRRLTPMLRSARR